MKDAGGANGSLQPQLQSRNALVGIDALTCSIGDGDQANFDFVGGGSFPGFGMLHVSILAIIRTCLHTHQISFKKSLISCSQMPKGGEPPML